MEVLDNYQVEKPTQIGSRAELAIEQLRRDTKVSHIAMIGGPYNVICQVILRDKTRSPRNEMSP